MHVILACALLTLVSASSSEAPKYQFSDWSMQVEVKFIEIFDFQPLERVFVHAVANQAFLHLKGKGVDGHHTVLKSITALIDNRKCHCALSNEAITYGVLRALHNPHGCSKIVATVALELLDVFCTGQALLGHTGHTDYPRVIDHMVMNHIEAPKEILLLLINQLAEVPADDWHGAPYFAYKCIFAAHTDGSIKKVAAALKSLSHHEPFTAAMLLQRAAAGALQLKWHIMLTPRSELEKVAVFPLSAKVHKNLLVADTEGYYTSALKTLRWADIVLPVEIDPTNTIAWEFDAFDAQAIFRQMAECDHCNIDELLTLMLTLGSDGRTSMAQAAVDAVYYMPDSRNRAKILEAIPSDVLQPYHTPEQRTFKLKQLNEETNRYTSSTALGTVIENGRACVVGHNLKPQSSTKLKPHKVWSLKPTAAKVDGPDGPGCSLN